MERDGTKGLTRQETGRGCMSILNPKTTAQRVEKRDEMERTVLQAVLFAVLPVDKATAAAVGVVMAKETWR